MSPSTSVESPRDGRARWRLRTALTVLLTAAVLVLGNHLAREHLRAEFDLSEDQLFAPSPVGRRLVSELPELLRVKAFFTGNVELGVVQIAKRRLVDQLEEYVERSGGRLELSFADPNTSSEARAEAQALGLAPVPLADVQGTSRVSQDIWLGLVLRYRGAEHALPFVLPQTFEYAFLSAVRKLTRAEPRSVGFLVGDGRGGPDPFTGARAALANQYRLREVLDLELGETVPADVTVLVIARPRELHPRAVFAVDQFLQRGGRALVLVDRAAVDLEQGVALPITTGLEAALATWGVRVEGGLVWDRERCNSIRTQESLPGPGGPRAARSVSTPFPLWPNLGSDGLSRESPVTAQLPGADLFWVHPVVPAERVPANVELTELLWSSPSSFVVPATRGAEVDPRVVSARSVELMATGGGDRRVVALSLRGRFPTPFERGAPAPFDPVQAVLGDGDAAAPPATTDEPVRSAAAESQLVVVGDADWASDGKFFTDRNRALFVNLVDWLALEDDLIALRSRVPRERKIDDFLDEERRALGLVGPQVRIEGEEEHVLARMETRAARAAARRRWLAMGATTGGAIALWLALFGLWRLTAGRPAAIGPVEEEHAA